MSKQSKIVRRILWTHTRNALRVLAVLVVIVGVGWGLKALMRYIHDQWRTSWTDAISIVIIGSFITLMVVGMMLLIGGYDAISDYFYGVRKQAQASVEREEQAQASERETLLRGSGK